MSVSTVSKALNGHPDVATGTQQRVHRIAVALGYHRRQWVRRATGGRSLRMVVETADNLDHPELVRAVEKTARTHGYNLVVSVRPETWPGAAALPDDCTGQLFCFTGADTVRNGGLAGSGVPHVYLAPRSGPLDDTVTVTAQEWMGGYEAARHLLSLGHRRVAALGSPASDTDGVLAGFRTALAAAGFPMEGDCLELLQNPGGEPAAQVARLLALPELPTAVFATTDALVGSIYRGAAERGIRIPADLSVIGFGSPTLTNWTYPPLTVVLLPLTDMARTAVETLVRVVEGGAPPSASVELPARLLVRSSTGPFLVREQ